MLRFHSPLMMNQHNCWASRDLHAFIQHYAIAEYKNRDFFQRVVQNTKRDRSRVNNRVIAYICMCITKHLFILHMIFSTTNLTKTKQKSWNDLVVVETRKPSAFLDSNKIIRETSVFEPQILGFKGAQTPQRWIFE